MVLMVPLGQWVRKVLRVKKVIKEEENAFLRTLENGLRRLNEIFARNEGTVIPGDKVFELYDTYGFPADLTRVIAEENGFVVDEAGFLKEMENQKMRSKAAGKVEAADWVVLHEGEPQFTGYDEVETKTRILKYRKVKYKNKEAWQLVLEATPFYAESGGQIGDSGYLQVNGERVRVVDTKKENELIVHFTDKLPAHPEATVTAHIDEEKRRSTANNHSATHLLHAALKQVLGPHVQQKGSYVGPDYLRFDFSHFEKVTPAQQQEIEQIVNDRILQNIPLEERRNVPLKEALDQGATALFGEKYGDFVRMICFDRSFSTELCGGTHVQSTGQIGIFKIISESAVAAGVRRIEALTGKGALEYIDGKLQQLEQVAELVKNPKDVVRGVEQLIEENTRLRKEVEKLGSAQVGQVKGQILDKKEMVNGAAFIGAVVDVPSAGDLKNLSFEILKEGGKIAAVLGAVIAEKPLLNIAIDKDLAGESDLHAGNIVREAAKEIKGGGGGQPFFASAGGSDASGLERAVAKAREMIISKLSS